MNPLELSPLADLCSSIAGLLKTEIGPNGQVSAVANQIVISISKFEVEHRLGNLLQQIYKSVDLHFPARKENISLIIRDAEGVYENCFKIWHTVTKAKA